MSAELAELILADATEKMDKAVVARPRRVRRRSAPGGPPRRWSRSSWSSTTAPRRPLQQLAGFQVPEARQLLITPYDKSSMGAIEKAIQQSDLGLNPSNDGVVIRLSFPPLTDERRKEFVKVVEHMAEDGQGRPAEPAPGGPPRARGPGEGRRPVERRARPGPRRSSTSIIHEHEAEIDQALGDQGTGAARGLMADDPAPRRATTETPPTRRPRRRACGSSRPTRRPRRSRRGEAVQRRRQRRASLRRPPRAARRPPTRACASPWPTPPIPA